MMPHSLKSKIKSLCYKGEITEKERDRIIHALEQQPKMQDCEHCIHTYGTLGCCDMVNNEWIYDCEFGKEQYKKEHESQPCEDCISREAVIKIFGEVHPLDYNKQSYIANIQKLPSVTPQQTCEEENPTCTECRYYDKEKHHCPRFCRVIENTMAEITSEQTRWIPVSERLPKVADCYNVTRKIGSELITDVCCFDGIDTWHNDNRINHERNYLIDIIAWMPLPQPYKAESEE